MKRTVRFTLIGIVVLLLAAYVVGDLFLGAIVTKGVNTFAPRYTHSSVVLRAADISPLTGGGTLTGLTVGNPKGWSPRNALSFGSIRVRVVPSSLWHHPVVVKEIVIDKPVVLYETKLVASNLGDLLSNIEGSSGGGSPSGSSGDDTRFEIRRFRLEGGVIRLGVGPTAVSLPLPPITLENLGTSQGGITGGQLALAVMHELTGNVAAATTRAAGKLGSTLGAAADNGAKDAFGRLKGLFGGKR